ncbi:MAG: hypothetical protein JNM76_03505 [Betaproteobacteria bacterium]|nr:hypothetical protein [Betaproteobacteria bacterium]
MSALCAAALPSLAQTVPEPGLMLREGTWNGDVGSFVVPASLEGKPARIWPADGWIRLRQKGASIQLDAVVAPPSTRPAFLERITRAAETAADTQPRSDPIVDPETMFLRVPGAKFRQGAAMSYVFRNGTPQLSPILDHRYELKLGDKPFAFRVQNGLRGKNGEPYGDGAHYFIEYDSQHYEYSLEGFGWDSRIQAIADLDGDGKPDFLINVGGSNSGHEYLLLSSVAKPGRNPPTASLHSQGC